MHQDIENIIKKNLPEKVVFPELMKYVEMVEKARINGKYDDMYDNGFNQALSQINTSLIADEVLKITKCNCCDEEDEHIFKDDRSTTRISRPCSGCGKHQTIAGALLKSKEWEKWYKYASENMLFDVDETLTVDAMSDEHWNSFMKFLNDEVLKVEIEAIEKLFEPIEDWIGEQVIEYRKQYNSGLQRVINLLSEHLSPNKENENNG